MLGILAAGARRRGDVLALLAQIGDMVVQGEFRKLCGAGPKREFELEYAMHMAGWDLDGEGRYQRLHSEHSRELQIVPSSEPSMGVMVPRSDRCPWCRNPLTDLLDVDLSQLGALSDSGLPSSGRLRLPFCVECTYDDGATFGQVGWDGASRLLSQESEGDRKPSEDPRSWPRKGASVGALRRTPLEGVLLRLHGPLPGVVSQLGGLPAWAQNLAYPLCPTSERRMPFVAQIDTSEVDEHGWGYYYAFVCAGCRSSATVFQQ